MAREKAAAAGGGKRPRPVVLVPIRQDDTVVLVPMDCRRPVVLGPMLEAAMVVELKWRCRSNGSVVVVAALAAVTATGHGDGSRRRVTGHGDGSRRRLLL